MAEETKAVSTEIKKTGLLAEKDGRLIGTTLEDQYRIAQYYVKSGMLPKGYDSPERVIIGMQYAREFNLAPLSALRQIAVIQGTPSFFGDLPLGIVRASGKLKSLKEEFFDRSGKTISRENGNLAAEVYGATCVAVRMDGPNEQVIERSYTLDDAKRAGLLGKSGPWTQHTKRMLQLRSRSWSLKDGFGDVLCGGLIAEWEYNTLPESGTDTSDPHDKASRLMSQLKPEPKEVTVDVVQPAPESGVTVHAEESIGPFEKFPDQGSFAEFSETVISK